MTSYSAPSNTVIAGGRFFRPAWRRVMAANIWAEVPGNTLSDIDPADDPAINPNHPSSPPWRAVGGQQQIIGAWCGGCYDQDGDVLWLPLSGGHDDYAGNEPYRVRLRRESCDWEMLRNPTGAIGNTGVLDDGQESSGVYFDGRPRAVHSYNKCVYVPGVGPMLAVQGSTYRSGQAGTRKPIIVDEVTGEATFGTAAPSGGNATGSAACWDSTRSVIYWRGAGTTSILSYDPALDEWDTVQTSGVAALSGACALAYSADLDCVLLFNGSLTNDFAVFNPATGALVQPGVSGSPVGSSVGGSSQPVWVPSLGGFAWWDNSTDTGTINLISPGADPFVDDWTISQLSFSGAVTPTARSPNGTYGRFFYSSKLNGFGVINDVTEPLYFFALD